MRTVEELVAFAETVEGKFLPGVCTYTGRELSVLARQLVALQPYSRVVEIGTFVGRSASLALQLQVDLSLDIHMIDNWMTDGEFTPRAFVDLLFQHFNNTRYTFHHISSDLLTWGKPIDFLHIDGCHDAPAVEKDCARWLPWVAPSGVVAFHDTDCPPVIQAVDRYVRNEGWEQVEQVERVTMFRRRDG